MTNGEVPNVEGMVRRGVVVTCLAVALLAACAASVYYRSRVAALEAELHRVAAIHASEPVAAETVPAKVHVPDRADTVGPKAVLPLPPRAASEVMATARVEILPLPAGTAVSVSSPADPATFLRRGEDWMSALRTNDPVLFDAIELRRQEMRERAKTAFAAATNYFLCRDVSKMSATDAEEFGLMIMLLEETRALSLKVRAGIPSEERWQAMSTIRSNMVVLAPLLENERERELYDMAVAMGQNTSSASQMVGYINQISSNTSLRTIFPDLPRGRPEGGPSRFSPGGRMDDGRRRAGAPPTPPP